MQKTAAKELPYTYLSPVSSAKVWLTAFIQPFVSTYSELINSPHATTRQALIFVIAGSFIASLMTLAVDLGLWLIYGVQTDVASIVWLFLFAPIIAVLNLILESGAIHFIALLFGGKGKYGKLTFALAAFIAPFLLISVPFFPFIKGTIVAFVLYPYLFYLHVAAVIAVYRFSLARGCLIIALSSIIIGITATALFALVPISKPTGQSDFCGKMQGF